MKVMLGRLMPGFFLSKRGALERFSNKFSDDWPQGLQTPWLLSQPSTAFLIWANEELRAACQNWAGTQESCWDTCC